MAVKSEYLGVKLTKEVLGKIESLSSQLGISKSAFAYNAMAFFLAIYEEDKMSKSADIDKYESMMNMGLSDEIINRVMGKLYTIVTAFGAANLAPDFSATREDIEAQ